jgi:hypothetical protein
VGFSGGREASGRGTEVWAEVSFVFMGEKWGDFLLRNGRVVQVWAAANNAVDSINDGCNSLLLKTIND